MLLLLLLSTKWIMEVKKKKKKKKRKQVISKSLPPYSPLPRPVGANGSQLHLMPAAGCLFTATDCVKMLSLPDSLVTEIYFYKVITTTTRVHYSVQYAQDIHCYCRSAGFYKACVCFVCFYSPSLQTDILSLHCL